MSRMRSPAYPALSLSNAVEMIRKVHGKQQTKPEPRKVVMLHMGYSSENGRALKAISALIKYGFLAKEGENGLRVSKRAMSILYPASEADKQEALRAAANEPALFEQIFQHWGGNRPSPESLKHYLIHRGFNANHVDNVARAFYETFDLVSSGSDSYDSASPEPDDGDIYEAEEDAMPDTTPDKSEPKKGGLNFLKTMRDVQMANLRNVTRPIFDFETVQVHTAIDNQGDLDELIERLQKIRSMLPPKADH
ncbi:hypothetical protein NKJ70_21305 [Mesorhizobium sp. M0092]|uniref:hypothetical protein n=1 Tax=Mesorhizobium sp. M0092 TaxID=2956876 RepID=UPI00333863EF